MPTNQPTDTPRIFEFSLSKEGKFTYTPPGTWDYKHGDSIRFQTNAGPFQISFVPVGDLAAPEDPLGGPLTSTVAANGLHIADTVARDKLTDSERALIVQAHIDAGHSKGFVALYRYALEVTDAKGQKHADNQKNGSFSC